MDSGDWAVVDEASVRSGQRAHPTAHGRCSCLSLYTVHLPLSSFRRFSVSKRIFVVGFGLYGSIHGPTDYQVNIQVACQPLPWPCCQPAS